MPLTQRYQKIDTKTPLFINSSVNNNRPRKSRSRKRSTKSGAGLEMDGGKLHKQHQSIHNDEILRDLAYVIPEVDENQTSLKHVRNASTSKKRPEIRRRSKSKGVPNA